MPAAHKGAISFGLVHIPVALHTATQDNDIHFNQLCREDGSRIKYKKVCANCGKEVRTADIVKGFEFAPDQYVTMTDADFEKAKTSKDKTIQIIHFTDIRNIRPIYFDKTYHVVPEAGGDKAYELLRSAMHQKEKVAIAKTVLGQSEKLLCLMATEKGILAETLFFRDEVKELPKETAHPELNEQELSMAGLLISSMDKAFEPQLYHDEYQARLREIIEAKINGQEVVMTPAKQPDNVISLMEALQKSLEQTEGTPPPSKPGKAGKAVSA